MSSPEHDADERQMQRDLLAEAHYRNHQARTQRSEDSDQASPDDQP